MSNPVKIDDAKVYAAFLEWCKNAPLNVMYGLWVWGEHVLTEAVKLAPLNTGALRRSAFQTPTRREGGETWRCDIGFGARHALEVHERTEKSYEVGGPKFLERALQLWSGKLMPMVSEIAEARLKEGKNAIRTGRGKFPNHPPKS